MIASLYWQIVCNSELLPYQSVMIIGAHSAAADRDGPVQKDDLPRTSRTARNDCAGLLKPTVTLRGMTLPACFDYKPKR